MRTFRILFLKELKSYFLSPFGWLILAFSALMQGIILSLVLKGFKDSPRSESLVHQFFQDTFFWFFFLFLFPVLTMRLFSEEKRSGTLEGLLTAPVKIWHIVLSKFSAAYLCFLILWIPSIIHFKLFTILTDVPAPFTNYELIGALIGVFLIGSLFTSIGCLASSLTSSQIIAGLICVAFLLIHFLLGFVTTFFGSQIPAAPLFDFISPQSSFRVGSSTLVRSFIISQRPDSSSSLLTIFSTTDAGNPEPCLTPLQITKWPRHQNQSNV